MILKAILGAQIFVVMLVLLGLSFSSCEEVESLTDVKFNATFGGDIRIVIEDCGQVGEGRVDDLGCSFSGSIPVNLRSDPDVDKYYSDLKDFDILGVTGEVKSVSGGPVIINGTLSISAGQMKASWIIDNFTVESGARITLDNANGQWDTVNKILDSKKDFTISIDGKSDKGNVSFVIYVEIRTKVTANPL